MLPIGLYVRTKAIGGTESAACTARISGRLMLETSAPVSRYMHK